MGFLVEDEDEALMWRGLMLNRAVQHFLEDVRWGDLDYLLIDMPPGTGDVQMGLARMLPRAEMLIVTTPALGRPEGGRPGPPTWPARATCGWRRDREHGAFVRPTAGCPLFGSGRGQALADEIGAPLLARIPIEAAVAAGGDAGAGRARRRRRGRRLPRPGRGGRHRGGAAGRHGRLLGPAPVRLRRRLPTPRSTAERRSRE